MQQITKVKFALFHHLFVLTENRWKAFDHTNLKNTRLDVLCNWISIQKWSQFVEIIFHHNIEYFPDCFHIFQNIMTKNYTLTDYLYSCSGGQKCSKFEQYLSVHARLLLVFPFSIQEKYLSDLPSPRSRVCQSPFVELLSLWDCHTHPGDVTVTLLLQWLTNLWPEKEHK